MRYLFDIFVFIQAVCSFERVAFELGIQMEMCLD